MVMFKTSDGKIRTCQQDYDAEFRKFKSISDEALAAKETGSKNTPNLDRVKEVQRMRRVYDC